MSPIEKLDRESCYRAVKSRDRRFDGVFYTAVHLADVGLKQRGGRADAGIVDAAG